jgi:hypothetical protein
LIAREIRAACCSTNATDLEPIAVVDLPARAAPVLEISRQACVLDDETWAKFDCLKIVVGSMLSCVNRSM